jgi:bifunctional DNA-binding transcriptional regulator/antitoxin component of YhaV-PrlF toxin-antitoxin module
MTKSTITVKYQTTVPKEVREKLGVGPQDVLQWEVADGYVRVSAAGKAFLRRRGTIHVGAGSTAADVREARSRRGSETG